MDAAALDTSLLHTLERLLAIEATSLRGALEAATDHVAAALNADKVDAFILELGSATLVALGVSDTQMGRQQRAIGLDRLPLANGGRTVQVFESDAPFRSDHLDADPEELRGIVEGLGVRSTIAVPLHVGGERRGVLQVASAQPAFFDEQALRFLEAVARWVGMLAHRAELVEQVEQEALERGRQLVAEELVTMLAHDLRNHITPLKARLQMLRVRADRDARQRDLRDLNDAAGALARLEDLIEDLLDISRLEAGLFAMDINATDVAQLARETAAALQTAEVAVAVDAPDELLACVDARRLRQALENLLSNAVKHSPRGGRVEISVRERPPEHPDVVAITVRDEGPGIAPELMPRLFQRFMASGPGGGIGLGLYMAREIALAHGGTLTAASEPGAGAAFTLTLPIGEP